MSETDLDRARRLVVQHLRTASLLGADCAPVFSARRPGSPTPIAPAIPARDAADEPSAVLTSSPPIPPAAAQLFQTPTHQPSAPAPRPRDSAAVAARLAQIRARYEHDAPHKAFGHIIQNIVFGEGDACARLMFVGEAPGAEEDRTGRPFVGRAGELLGRMISAMGLTREQVYIANVLKTRPPENATPTIQEAERCAPYLYEQIDAVSPEVIVTLGLPATRLLLRTEASMSSLRGHWADFVNPITGARTPVMPTFHPAYVLRQYTPEVRGKVWSDLKQAMDRLGLTPPAGG